MASITSQKSTLTPIDARGVANGPLIISHFYGLRPARNVSRSGAARLVLAGGGEAFSNPARNLVADSWRRGGGWGQAVRPLRRKSLSDRGGQGIPEICRGNSRCPQGDAGFDRRNGARAAGRDYCGGQRGHLPAHPALRFRRL